MPADFAKRLLNRKLLTGVFAGALAMSLVCSLSIQQGHADVPVAASAEHIQPLRAGQDAPGFVVETVAGKRFQFAPDSLDRPAILISFRGGWCPYCNMHLSELRHVLPVPSVFAVDTEGVIRFAYTNADYKMRLPADELLAVARDLASD